MSGLGIALLCLITAVVRGSSIPPEGKMLDAATFPFGVGLFILTLALLLPLAGFSPPRPATLAKVVLRVLGFRLRPRTASGIPGHRSPLHGSRECGRCRPGHLFWGHRAAARCPLRGLCSAPFRDDVLQDYPTLRLGIRYGVVAVALSFGIGIS